MEKRRYLPLIILLVSLFACVSQPSDQTEALSPGMTSNPPESLTASELGTEEATAILSMPSETPTQTLSRSIIQATNTPVVPVIEISATPEPTEQPHACSPLEGHPIDELREIISAPYDPPPPGKEERHHGVDFSYYRRGERTTIEGVGVQALFSGRVAASLTGTFPYGNVIIIETRKDALPDSILGQIDLGEGQSLYTLYAHLKDPPLVSVNEEVDACQLIGYVGFSGNAVEPHLHLETRRGPFGVTFLGMSYYSTQTTPEERANYEHWRTGGEFIHFDPMDLLIR